MGEAQKDEFRCTYTTKMGRPKFKINHCWAARKDESPMHIHRKEGPPKNQVKSLLGRPKRTNRRCTYTAKRGRPKFKINHCWAAQKDESPMHVHRKEGPPKIQDKSLLGWPERTNYSLIHSP